MMNKVQESEKSEPGTKKSALVFTMFYVLGTLSHVPQSFYITANGYWMYKFRNPDDGIKDNSTNFVVKTDLQTKFTSYYSVASSVSMITIMVVTIFLIKRFTAHGRIITTLSLLLVLLFITIIFAWIDTDSWQAEFFIISLVIGVLLNAVGACFLLSIYHLAMKFPAEYLGAVLSGQSICGIMSAVIQIATLGMGTSALANATIYFVIGAAFVAVVQVMFFTVLIRQKYYQEQVHKEAKHDPIKVDWKTILLITKKIWVVLVTMILTSGMMVVMHPGITSLVESTDKGNGRWGDVFFVPVCTFFLFNVVDFIGRECSFRFKWVKNNWIILIIAVLRLSFIPALLVCNVQPRKHLQVFFGEDWEYAIVLVFFAFSSGYVINLCVVGLPSIVSPQEMPVASNLIVLVMVVSLAICSFLGPVTILLV